MAGTEQIPAFSTCRRYGAAAREMYIFAVEKYRAARGQFPPCLVVFRPAPPYIGWRTGGKSTVVIHNLWKTAVEKLHTHRFRVYFRENMGFSTAVFNNLWITAVGFAPVFPQSDAPGRRICAVY